MYDWDKAVPTFNVWVRLRQAEEAVQRVLEEELSMYQTTLPHVDVLMTLSVSKDPLTPTQIASYIFREKHSVSGLLTRMQKAGYVKKVRSRKDKRVVRIRMQPKGEELLQQLVTSGFVYAHRIVKSSLSEEEIEQLDQLLKKLRDGALQILGLEAEPYPLNTLYPPRMLRG